MPFIPDSDVVTIPTEAELVASEFAQASIPAAKANSMGSWWIYALIAVALYMLWED